MAKSTVLPLAGRKDALVLPKATVSVLVAFEMFSTGVLSSSKTRRINTSLPSTILVIDVNSVGTVMAPAVNASIGRWKR